MQRIVGLLSQQCDFDTEYTSLLSFDLIRNFDLFTLVQKPISFISKQLVKQEDATPQPRENDNQNSQNNNDCDHRDSQIVEYIKIGKYKIEKKLAIKIGVGLVVAIGLTIFLARRGKKSQYDKIIEAQQRQLNKFHKQQEALKNEMLKYQEQLKQMQNKPAEYKEKAVKKIKEAMQQKQDAMENVTQKIKESKDKISTESMNKTISTIVTKLDFRGYFPQTQEQQQPQQLQQQQFSDQQQQAYQNSDAGYYHQQQQQQQLQK
ncbi:hypothetical protein PPERSA_04858 [Pseudocohnilembus persalinus]|uniref:Transmembrane protein n=1 Tax=Pseudocohnilembus persalinus TaxID=266149 RepID=A0A0V0QJA8_PSEPJ|nr:hypothetical protein PPERSA_04858 [Pseudocohnilembus persalinus]|eukprot:KRX02236.1 hypothetical protein PPERSA_04858 [Pseudocohnilembus persalinus]